MPKFLGAAALLLVFVGALFIWIRGLRPPPPIRFTGEHPPATFITIPVVPRFTRSIMTGRVPAGVAVGYLRWNDGRTKTSATYRVGSVLLPILPATLREGKVPLTYVPFVTDERFQSATLLDGDLSYPVELPVDKSYGGPVLPIAEAVCGPWKVTVSPRLWVASSQPYLADLTVKGPSAYSVWISDYDSYLLAPDRPVEAQLRDPIAGDLYQVKEVTLRVKEQDGTLLRSDGKVVFNPRSKPSEYAGFRIGNRWLAQGSTLNGDDIPYVQAIPELATGEYVKVTAYRIVARYPINLSPEIPPILQTRTRL